MNWGWFLIRVTVGLSVLAALVLSQRYWHRSVWRLTVRIRNVYARAGLRLVWLAALGLMIFAVIDVARLNRQHMLHLGSPLIALAGLWFTSALFAYLAVKLVKVFDRLWHAARRLVARRRAASIKNAPAAAPPPPVHPVPSPAVAGTPPAASVVNDALQNPSRRYFFQTATAVAGAMPFLGAIYGFAAERLRYQVRQIEIPIDNLPSQLDGLRIVQISDIHRSNYMPREAVRRAVDMANALQADLAVVTGDFITGAGDPLAECIGEVARLKATLGVWGCNGNHEIYAGVEAASQRLFAQSGMRLLRQENAQLDWRGAKFNLIGVDYQRQRSSNGARIPMLPGVDRFVRRDMPNILLSHNPNTFPRAADLGIELSLAGHTHGGQVQVEILDHRLSPARFITNYVAGHYQRHVTPLHSPMLAGRTPLVASLYVNRGLGTVGAPVRLGVPPEITLIILKRA